jgi:hypothetical protein
MHFPNCPLGDRQRQEKMPEASRRLICTSSPSLIAHTLDCLYYSQDEARPLFLPSVAPVILYDLVCDIKYPLAMVMNCKVYSSV